jgi:non-specific serine/threonine protein kinase
MLLDQLRNQNGLLQKEEQRITSHSLWRQEFHGTTERQRTMQRTLDWSYHLLSKPLQHIFTQLSVFAGCWSLEAARYVCESSEEDLRTSLEELVNQSLLLLHTVAGAATTHEPHFVFLKIIREYALTRWMDHSAYEAARKRHVFYYLSLARRIEPQLWSKERSEAVRQLTREHENLHAALHWSIEHEDGTLAQQFCAVLGIYWEARNQFIEGRRWLDAALSLNKDSTPLTVHATCLLMASRLAIWEMSYQRSRGYAQQALTLYERAHNDVGRERALFQIGDAWHLEGEHRTAIGYFEECLTLQRRLGEQRDYAFTLGRLGAISLLSGDTAHVEAKLREAVAIFRGDGELSGLGVILNYLSMLLLFQGRLSEALPPLRESLEIAQAEGYHYNLATTLTIFGCVLGNIAGPEATAHLCGAAEMHFQQIGSSFPKGYQPIYRWYLTGIQAQADVHDWDRWWQEGRRLSMPQAISLAYQESMRAHFATHGCASKS